MAKYIKDARKKAGMTLEKLGSALSCGKQNVWSWENGLHDPSPEQLARIAIVTNVSLPEELSPSVGHKAETQAIEAAHAGVAAGAAIMQSTKSTYRPPAQQTTSCYQAGVTVQCTTN